MLRGIDAQVLFPAGNLRHGRDSGDHNSRVHSADTPWCTVGLGLHILEIITGQAGNKKRPSWKPRRDLFQRSRKSDKNKNYRGAEEAGWR